MTSNLNVIALISGGKDSLFSILHCIANGHTVIALANLYPPARTPSLQSLHLRLNGDLPKSTSEDNEEDLNSYLYQTVGHSVIPLYAEALGLPLYRQEITGTAIKTDKIYAPSSLDGKSNDETEALISLLRNVMAAHPTANAVSTGAILSDYQRTRVESVAIRLGLVPLSFLWQYPYLPPDLQTSLLDDMAVVGQEVAIIKVASGGLDESFLWGNVADAKVKTRMVRAMERFGAAENGAVLGEGGEYETLALDGPRPMWKKRIVVEKGDTEVVMGGGGMVSLRIKGARLVDKGKGMGGEASISDLRIPELLDRDFEYVRKTLQDAAWATQKSAVDVEELLSSFRAPTLTTVHSRTARAWTIANLTAPQAGTSAETQMRAIEDKFTLELDAATTTGESPSTNDVVFATVLLRSMDDFAAVNQVYANLFTRPNPPARVTVACGEVLPEAVRVMVSFVIDLGRRCARQGLHVQSRSYWAPANIGPYSQAIAVPVDAEQVSSPALVYIAGQIPLIPASMKMAGLEGLDADMDPMAIFRTQALLSLQHLWRIGRATDVTWWTGCIAFIAGNGNIQLKALTAWRIWASMHNPSTFEDDSDQEDNINIDVWDQKYGGSRSRGVTGASNVQHRLPSYEDTVVGDKPLAAYPIPSFFAVQVDELPRGADIEWQSLGVAGGRVYINENANERMIKKSCSFGDHQITILYCSILPTCSVDELQQILVEIIEGERVKGEDGGHSPHITIYTRYTSSCQHLAAQIVPCRSVWDSDGMTLAAGVIVRRDCGCLSHGVREVVT